MNNNASAGGLAALLLAASAGPALASDAVPCVPDSVAQAVAREIPRYFKEVRPNTYLIEFVPESKNDYELGGQLTVFIPEESDMSIFDRTDMDKHNWYNVSNSDGQGCADFGIRLIGPPAIYLSQDEIQAKFNVFIDKVTKKMRE